jgi:hypothetical protein
VGNHSAGALTINWEVSRYPKRVLHVIDNTLTPTTRYTLYPSAKCRHHRGCFWHGRSISHKVHKLATCRLFGHPMAPASHCWGAQPESHDGTLKIFGDVCEVVLSSSNPHFRSTNTGNTHSSCLMRLLLATRPWSRSQLDLTSRLESTSSL